MPELSFAFSRTWTVRLPVLVRQMNTQYVEDFFRDGSLRLSSFESFRKHPDESRRDGQEGFVAMEIAAPDGTLNVLGANSQEAYIISASTVEAAPQAPGSEYSSFRITNTLGFADAVSRQIPSFLGGVEGHCIYRDNTFIRKADTRSVAPPASGVDAERWFAEQQSYVGR